MHSNRPKQRANRNKGTLSLLIYSSAQRGAKLNSHLTKKKELSSTKQSPQMKIIKKIDGLNVTSFETKILSSASVKHQTLNPCFFSTNFVSRAFFWEPQSNVKREKRIITRFP